MGKPVADIDGHQDHDEDPGHLIRRVTKLVVGLDVQHLGERIGLDLRALVRFHLDVQPRGLAHAQLPSMQDHCVDAILVESSVCDLKVEPRCGSHSLQVRHAELRL